MLSSIYSEACSYGLYPDPFVHKYSVLAVGSMQTQSTSAAVNHYGFAHFNKSRNSLATVSSPRPFIIFRS